MPPDQQELDNSDIACIETRRDEISPQQIKCVMIPEKYREEFTIYAESGGIPKEKIIFVPSVPIKMSISYKDGMDVIQCKEMEDTISVPDYQKELSRIVEEEGRDLTSKPLFTHMTRLSK